MYVWRHVPLLRFLIPFILGILIANRYNFSFKLVLGVLIVSIVVLIIGHFYLKKNVNHRVIKGLSLTAFCSLFIAGILVTSNFKLDTYSNYFGNQKDYDTILARIIDSPDEKTNSIGCELSINKVYRSDSGIIVVGKAKAYFEKDSNSRQLKYGDYVLIQKYLKPIESSINPHQFDFKNYYSTKNIYHQSYIKADLWTPTNHNKSYLLFEISYKWQELLKAHFDKYFTDDAIKGVAQAIVFGYKEDLDDGWMQAFSKTGTIHVLAVSGLHVGIIFILLSALLQLKSSRGRWLIIKSVLIIVILFLYCLVTGFAPSVSRAALMFSIVICAKAWKRNSNIYNTLAFAAFVLLIINPFNIYNVGFQFSFLAVIGIVYYKDFFRLLWPQSTYFGDKIVTLLAVSISAQITTFPIGLYYFHQYPNLFMFSNLIVIPCISVILYAGIFFVVTGSWSDILAKFFAKIVNLYIEFISKVVHYIQDVPYAFFENVHISLSQMLLIYSFIIFSTYTLVNKWKNGIVVCVVLVSAFLVVDYQYDRSLDRTEVVCFDIRNETLVGFRKNNHITFIASDKVYLDEGKLQFIVKPYLINERLTKSYSIYPMSCLDQTVRLEGLELLSNGLVWFDNRSYLFIDEMSSYVDKPIKGDYLIMGKGKSTSYLGKVMPKLEFSETLILNSWRSKEQNTCINSHVVVRQDGGCVILN